MSSYDSWRTDSGREDDGRYGELTYEVSCIVCSRQFYVPADEQGPYRCASHQSIDQTMTSCVRCGWSAPIPEGGDWRSVTWCDRCVAEAKAKREARR